MDALLPGPVHAGADPLRDQRPLKLREAGQALHEAMMELDHIREAIRKGLLTDLTRQMLEEIEAPVRDLRAKLEMPAKAQLHVLQVLPRIVQERLTVLDRVLAHDVTRAREALRDIVGDILLRPTQGD